MSSVAQSQPYSIPIYRVALVRDGRLACDMPQTRSSFDAARMFRHYLGDDADREHFLVAMIDQKNRLIGINTVAIGSLTAAVVAPREVFKAAILSNASGILACHNHPSSDPNPSQEDRKITHQLSEAGKMLGIKVLDHVIIGDGCERYFSFADEQLL